MAYVVVLTTVPKLSQARAIIRTLLKNRLAACITLSSPVSSHYVWKGKKEQSREYVLMIKTRRALFSKLEKVLHKIHPYEVPEILALPVTAGSRKYLDWLKLST